MECSGVTSSVARPLHLMPLMKKMGAGSRNLSSKCDSNTRGALEDNHLFENVLSAKQGWSYVPIDAGHETVADVL